MAYHLHFVAQKFHRLIETIKLGIERHGCREVEHIIEVIRCVAHFGTEIGVPLPAYLARIHAVGHLYAGRYIDIFQHVKGGRHRHAVLHTIAPIAYQTLFEELILRRGKRILEYTRIRYLYLFIPTLGANCSLALEWRYLRHCHRQVGERHGECGVAGALRHVGCG